MGIKMTGNVSFKVDGKELSEADANRYSKVSAFKQARLREHGCADPRIVDDHQGIADYRVLVCGCGERVEVTGMELAAV